MRTTEYSICVANLFEAAQFFDELEGDPEYEHTLISKNSSFCHIRAKTPFQISILWELPNTLVKVKGYRKGKVKYTIIKERT